MVGFLSFFSSCNPDTKKDSLSDISKPSLYKGEFGTCCKDLKDAMDKKIVPNSFFRIEENNVLYQTVGYIDTENGPGYFDQAVIYCPFCGTKLQDKEEIQKRRSP